MNKDKVIFYLKRHLREADSNADITESDLARQGIALSRRRAILDARAPAKEEAEALRIAINAVQNSID